MLGLLHIVLTSLLINGISDRNIYLQELTSSNSNLSNDHITALCGDSAGFMWIGTASGLNRFDTHTTQVFRNDDLGLHTDYVRCIFEDSDGDVWIGTDSGLTMYDRDLDIFVPLNKRSNQGCVISKRTSHIGEDPEGRIWISVGDIGLFCYDKKKDRLDQFFYEESQMMVERGITSFSFDNNGGILISFYQDNLYYFSIQDLYDGSYTRVRPLAEKFSNDHITAVCHIGSRIFAVASQNYGLCTVNAANGKVKSLISSKDSKFIPSKLICEDNTIMMSTNNGIYTYGIMDGSIRRMQNDPDNSWSLRSNDANCIEYSESFGLWVGLTGIGGVNYLLPDNNKFEKISFIHNSNSLKGAGVKDFAFDEKRNLLYIATAYKGILSYSLSTKNLHPLVNITQSVESICYDNDIIYIGSADGLYTYNTLTRNLTKDESVSHTNINCLGSTLDGRKIIIGTTLGMFLLDKASGGYEEIPSLKNIAITSFADNGNGFLWITTTNDGVIKLDIKDRSIAHHYLYDASDENSIPNNKCSNVNIDSDHNIWISTVGSGFCRISGPEITRYSINTHPELPSNCFYGIMHDRNGNYWAKTDKGLVKCDFTSGNFYTYNHNSGLLDNNLANSACWESLNGEIFIGSTDGFFSLKPENFKGDNEYKEEYNRPVFTNLYTSPDLNRKVTAKDSLILKKSIDLTERIELQPWENSFSIAVSRGRLTNEVGIVTYFLEGYDDTTNVLGRNGTISYSNLPPRTYTLYVSGHEPLVIVIKQYWYLTTTALTAYAIILLLAAALVVRYFYVLSEKRTRRRQEQKLFDEKLTFFSNIIHEIKTPIMLIESPLKSLTGAEGVSQHKDEIEVIANNADYLHKLVNELLDYIKNEKNKYVKDLTTVNLNRLLVRLEAEFAQAARDNALKLRFNLPEEEILVTADEPALLKILNNLLHNAVKYAKSYINLDVALKDISVSISLSNDGDLIPEDKREEIFKPFVQYSERKEEYHFRKGVGIGLAFARSLAAQLGGSLTLGDTPDITSFVLTLNRAAEAEAVTAGNEMNDSDISSSEKAILLVEDNRNLNEYLFRKLSMNWPVIQAYDTEQAMKILRKRHISLVISDIVLPKSSGIELCGKIHSSNDYSHIPVILMSSFSSDEVKINAVRSGAVLYLEKPFDLEYLKVNIQSILDKCLVDTGVGDKDLPHKLMMVSRNDRIFMEKAEAWVKENLSNIYLNNEMMAEELNISVPTLHRKLKTLTGLSPNKYIRKCRLDTAAKMLKIGGCRINEVSYSVGFETPSYFSKCFREQFGCLPQEYRDDGSQHV